MKGSKNGIGRGLLAAAAVVLALGAGLLIASQASAASATISVDSITVAPGEQGSVNLDALNATSPGLGAWEIDIVYNPAVVTAVACSPQNGSVCNPDYASNTVRIVGASAGGLLGNKTLGSITFSCDSEGSSALSLNIMVLADATAAAPVPMSHQAQNGAITCSSAQPPVVPTSTPGGPTEEAEPTATALVVTGLPPSGSGGSNDGAMDWLVAVSAGAALAAIAGFGALRLRDRRA
jgi:hypothetical protein